jgi:hypothetical protein
MSETGSSLASSLAAVTLHTAAMLAIMGLLAVIVYRWAGVDILRKAWVNLDLIWTVALLAAGGVTLGIGIVSLV